MFQSLVVKKWRQSQLYLEISWKIQNFYVNQQMPRIPGELAAKKTSKKKKGSEKKKTNLQFTPPWATNMEVNLWLVILVNVDFFFFRYGKRRGSNPSSTSFQAMAFTSTHLADAILQDVTEIAALAMTIHLALFQHRIKNGDNIWGDVFLKGFCAWGNSKCWGWDKDTSRDSVAFSQVKTPTFFWMSR